MERKLWITKFLYTVNHNDFMIVKEIMHNITKIPSDTSVSEVARIMDKKIIGSVLIEENHNVIGIMTERDILRKVVAKGKNPDQLTVKDIMSYPIITINADEDILEASKLMDKHKIRRLIVTEEGKIVGIITVNSISRNLKYLMVRDSFSYVRPEY